MKKCLIFRSKFLFNICFKSTKKLYEMATLTFRLGDHIFSMCPEKNTQKNSEKNENFELFFGFWFLISSCFLSVP
jgi:hypothetical protein